MLLKLGVKAYKGHVTVQNKFLEFPLLILKLKIIVYVTDYFKELNINYKDFVSILKVAVTL